MSDRFEDEVRSALRSALGSAPQSGGGDELSGPAVAAGLAEGARARLHRRRRTTSLVLGAAVVVAAVPIGLAAWHHTGSRGDGGPPVDVAVESGPPAWVPDGWRSESWGDAEFAVPGDWTDGAMTTWCLGDAGTDPGWKHGRVSRPNEMVAEISCGEPASSYGVAIADSSAVDPSFKSGSMFQYGKGSVQVYPEGAWIGVVQAGDWWLNIVAPDRSTAQAIIDTAHEITGVDAHGCTSRQDVPKLGEMTGPVASTGDQVSWCTYTASGDLVRSGGLDVAGSARLLDAIDSATKDGAGMAMPDCAAIDPDGTLVLRDGAAYAWIFDTGCSDGGIDRGGEILPLTSQVIDALGWADLAPPTGGGGSVVENPDGSVSSDGQSS